MLFLSGVAARRDHSGNHGGETNCSKNEKTIETIKNKSEMQAKAFMAKVQLEGVTQDIELPAPATLEGLTATFFVSALDLCNNHEFNSSSDAHRTVDIWTLSLSFE